MRGRITIGFSLGIACWASTACIALGTPSTAKAATPSQDPIQSLLFTPDEVLRHERDVQLGRDQKEHILVVVRNLSAEIGGLNPKLELARSALGADLKREPSNLAQAAADLAKVMAIEDQVKRATFIALVRIKNELTPQQRAKLQATRAGR